MQLQCASTWSLVTANSAADSAAIVVFRNMSSCSNCLGPEAFWKVARSLRSTCHASRKSLVELGPIPAIYGEPRRLRRQHLIRVELCCLEACTSPGTLVALVLASSTSFLLLGSSNMWLPLVYRTVTGVFTIGYTSMYHSSKGSYKEVHLGMFPPFDRTAAAI